MYGRPILKLFKMKNTGIELIAQERKGVIEKGYGNFDSEYTKEELLDAANAIILQEARLWPWNETLFPHYMRKPRVEQLAIAGQFIAAEIDRLQALEG